MHDVASPDCPTVPLPNSGTAGQSVCGTDIPGTDCGTIDGTLSLKALANCVLMRDKVQDTRRDSVAQAPSIAVPQATSRETGIGTLLGRQVESRAPVAVMRSLPWMNEWSA